MSHLTPFRPLTTHDFLNWMSIARQKKGPRCRPRLAFICSFSPVNGRSRKKPFSGSPTANRTLPARFCINRNFLLSGIRPVGRQLISAFPQLNPAPLESLSWPRYKPNWISKLIDSCKKTAKIYLFAFIYWAPCTLQDRKPFTENSAAPGRDLPF